MPIPLRVSHTKSNSPIDPVVTPDTYDVSIPTDFLAGEGTGNGIWLAAQKLLFPAAEKRLASMDGPSVLVDGAQLILQVC